MKRVGCTGKLTNKILRLHPPRRRTQATMCFLRLSLSLLMAIAFHISVTSPSKVDFLDSVTPSQVSIAEVFMRALLFCKSVVKVCTRRYRTVVGVTVDERSHRQIIYWGLTASEALHVLSNNQVSCSSVSLAYWIGTALTVAGCLIRVICYSTLGHMFTFTFTVQPGHHLITHGPYAFVRHPSYTGVMMYLVGIIMAQASPGSWLRDPASGMLTTPWGIFAVLLWLWSMGAVWTCLMFRMKDEDEMMREMFGDEWIRWASRVKYRLIPGVY